MNQLSEAYRDWNQLSGSDQAEILKRIEELAAMGTHSAVVIATKVGGEFKVFNVPTDKVLKAMARHAMKHTFVRRSLFETIRHLINLDGIGTAAGVLRRQKPTTAYKIIRGLLLSGKINGPQAISLICQSIPQKHWHEIGVQSIEDHGRATG
jgi:hypothetical protein